MEDFINGLPSERWTDEDIDLLKCLVALKIPIEIISEELERSLTVTGAKAVELNLNQSS
jgi:hypothetical protein